FVLCPGVRLGPCGSVARRVSQVKEAQGALARVFEILDPQPHVRDDPSGQPLPPIRAEVAMAGVSFAYDPRAPVLVDISFTAQPGELVAIVGPTGSGKTTLINLLHRFYDPMEGSVTIDGHDLRGVTLTSFYRQI